MQEKRIQDKKTLDKMKKADIKRKRAIICGSNWKDYKMKITKKRVKYQFQPCG